MGDFEGGARCWVTVKKRERERGMARGVQALMHSLCAGRVLLQNTHSHKHISTPRAPFARVKGRLAGRGPTSIAADLRPEPRRNILKSDSETSFDFKQ